VVDFETWQTEKQRYELTEVGKGTGTFAYVVKKSMRGSEPAHYACANCYRVGKASILQHMRTNSMGDLLTCTGCGTKSLVSWGYAPPI
jgi:hypothetical protein